MVPTARLQPGQRLGPYEIDSFVAAGGMGEVYKARDTRLDRFVAIKRLTHASERFEREARAIASLNHPNVCQIHDVGADYLVLEFIDGASLRGPMPAAEAVRIAIQIASALEAAHARGILHRDLKPANVIVTRTGEAKLLDFGLAKLARQEADVTRTMDGELLGTVPYMSPEQAEGRPLDERSDIFSFGAVLYELLSGRRAFEGTTTVQVLSAVLRDEPRLLDTSKPGLNHIVRRCLAKAPALRPQTISEVRAALHAIAGDMTPVQPIEARPSIAVLPFTDMSAARDHEWFADGLAEEIINALAQTPGIKVIARTSAFAFKGRQEDVRLIADTLGVAHVLEGSVRKAGHRVRVTVQLIAAADGSHLWSDRYDRDLEDVFAIQDEIARAIASALHLKLAARPGPIRRYTPNLPAYEAFLKGRHWLFSRLTPESVTHARVHFEHAIALDPAFALPHVDLANHYYVLAFLGLRPIHDVVPLIRAGVQRALDLEPSLPEAHAALGALAVVYEFDWKAADRQFALAMAHDPVPAVVRWMYGLYYLLLIGRPKDALVQFERALEDDPLNVGFRHCRAVSLLEDGRASEAAAEERALLKLDETAHPAIVGLSMACDEMGMASDARALAEKAHALAPWDAISTGLLGGFLMRDGDTSRARELLSQLPRLQAALGSFVFHCVAGDVEGAADWAEKAIAQRSPGIAGELRLPMARALRSSARWPALADMMKLPE